jgi:hypothetical protein
VDEHEGSSPSGGGAPFAARRFPRVPGYAWTWLQRSRPVVLEAAERLTGRSPSPGFVDDLRAAFERDPFTRDVVIGVVADVAFSGRVPQRRPPGASWDRGLTWWAAALAGTTPAEFESRSGAPVASQHRLFDAAAGSTGPSPVGSGSVGVGSAGSAARSDPQGIAEAARRQVGRRPISPERAALAAALRELIVNAGSDQVPASAIRQLLAELEGERPV